MDKTLQDLAWNCLPKEFKEEVKELYKHENKVLAPIDGVTTLNEIFGLHNLTSDAEGEEMLTVSRKKVQEMYAHYDKICNDPKRPKDHIESVYEYADGVTIALDDLFGSKCLPDNVATSEPNVDSSVGSVESLEPKPAEPKYHKDDKVLYNGAVHKITVGYGDGRYLLNNTQKVVKESDLEPYTEPEKEVVKMRLTTSKVSVYLATKEEDEEFRLLLHENGFRWISGDPLINNAYWNSYTEESKIYYFYPDKTVTYWGDKTSETLTFSEFKKQFFEEKPRKLSQETANCDYPVPDRLHIAAMAMQGLLSNADRMEMYEDIASYPPSDNLTRIVARNALRYADALIAEAEEGGKS